MSARALRRLLIALALVAEVVGLRMRSGRFAGNIPVRCRSGHVFTTLWIPLVSVKSLRLGWCRLQRCPVGHHFSLVVPLRESDLSARERRAARAHRDRPVP